MPTKKHVAVIEAGQPDADSLASLFILLGYARPLDERTGALYVIHFLHLQRPCSGNPDSFRESKQLVTISYSGFRQPEASM